MGIRQTGRLARAIIYLILILISAVFLFPIFHAVTTSLKFPVDAFSMPPKWIFKPTLQHHIHIWVKEPFLKYLINTLAIGFGTVGISVPIASLPHTDLYGNRAGR